MSAAPGSQLVALSQLQSLKSGTKVRFLGCVTKYTVETATLELRHAPSNASRASVAHVIVDQVLQTTKPSDIEDGAWINVVGYIIDGPRTAGTINLGAYERALELRQSV